MSRTAQQGIDGIETRAHVALADGPDFRRMQRVQLVLVLGPLLQDAADTAQQCIRPFPDIRRHTLQLPFDVPLHAPGA